MPLPFSRSIPRCAAALIVVGLVGCVVGPVPWAHTTSNSNNSEVVFGECNLRGRVTDPSGGALIGARLTTLPRGHGTTADAAGNFGFCHLPPGTYRVVAAAAGFAPIVSDEVGVQPGEVSTLDLRVVPLPAGGVVRVRALGPDDLPISGLEITSFAVDGRVLASAITDESGEAILTGVVDGSPRIVVQDPSGRSLPAELQAPEVSPAGGLQWTLRLSGRAPEGATYLGSGACGVCHTEQAARFSTTAHARALPSSPGPAFTMHFAGGLGIPLDPESFPEGSGPQVGLRLQADQALVRLVDATGTAQELVVAGLIGDDADRSVPWTEVGQWAFPLPLAWVAEDPERPGQPAPGGTLVPYEIERWFDGEGRFVELLPERSAEAECFACHATGFELAIEPGGGVEMTATRGGGRWREAGVGCERCHGPGGEHRSETATGAERDYIVSPARLDRQRAADLCGQCHANRRHRESGLPFPHRPEGPFFPGDRLHESSDPAGVFWPDGSGAAVHMQAEEFAASGHGVSGLGCTDCHDIHGSSGESHLLWLSGPDNSLCLSCHLALDFGGDIDEAEAHNGHARQDPEGRTQGGRCTGCHMPKTAAGVRWDPVSGAGDLSSHGFVAVPPAHTVSVFDAAAASSLPLGEYPAHACGDCHAWNATDWATRGVTFPGPAGDPGLRESHAEHQSAFVEKYP